MTARILTTAAVVASLALAACGGNGERHAQEAVDTLTEEQLNLTCQSIHAYGEEAAKEAFEVGYDAYNPEGQGASVEQSWDALVEECQ